MPESPAPQVPAASVSDDELFDWRWTRAGADLLEPLARLYGAGDDMARLERRLHDLLKTKWAERPADLRALDLRRDLEPDWFLQQHMAGYVFYTDRFAGTLQGLAERIPYLADLGITYAHLMPCLKPRPGANDGGYAVMDYGAIDPRLGTMDDFEAVTRKMRGAGMSTCIDIVLNHTAREHPWAEAARAADPHFQRFYRLFDDDRIPRQYEETLLEVFPDQAPGNFTWDAQMQKWVWTTFNTYQWDLNWENPDVFLAILGAILDLANKGAEIMRLDAVAFMWKRMGTVCQNLPEVHDILQALNQATSVAAAAVIHKAEAIVGPSQLVPYLGQGRHVGRVCNLAYHNSLMVQFWSSLATRDTGMMTDVLQHYFPATFRNAEWATYIRCHDDIGWAITEEDAERHGLTGPGHRGFLADFYNGAFEGSFARGADFQVNEATGDRRTNGSFASLAGLETALQSGDDNRIRDAVDRILMGHALIAGFGGIPLVYMGDEIGLPNDWSFLDDPDLTDDGRWVHRPKMDWDRAAEARIAEAPHGWIWRGLRHILSVRAATPQLRGDVPSRILDHGHPALFAVYRPGDSAPLTAVYNFTEGWQHVEAWRLGLDPDLPHDELLGGRLQDMTAGRIALPPYGRLWLVPRL